MNGSVSRVFDMFAIETREKLSMSLSKMNCHRASVSEKNGDTLAKKISWILQLVFLELPATNAGKVTKLTIYSLLFKCIDSEK